MGNVYWLDGAFDDDVRTNFLNSGQIVHHSCFPFNTRTVTYSTTSPSTTSPITTGTWGQVLTVTSSSGNVAWQSPGTAYSRYSSTYPYSGGTMTVPGYADDDVFLNRISFLQKGDADNLVIHGYYSAKNMGDMIGILSAEYADSGYTYGIQFLDDVKKPEFGPVTRYECRSDIEEMLLAYVRI